MSLYDQPIIHLASISLRVNGEPCDKIRLQMALEEGFPGGPNEIIVDTQMVKELTLSDSCIIELQEGAEDWQVVSLPYLKTMLEIAK